METEVLGGKPSNLQKIYIEFSTIVTFYDSKYVNIGNRPRDKVNFTPPNQVEPPKPYLALINRLLI